MKKALILLCLLCFGSASVQAQYNEPSQMSERKARSTIEKTLTEDVKNAAVPLNSKLDYIARNYDDSDLRALIKNYEKTNRKIAAHKGETYKPYDQRIDTQNPQKVKRYFRKRVDIIF